MKKARRKPELSIAETIRQGLGRLTPTERKSALPLLMNYPVPGLDPVAQFAKRAGVSGPTILRLVAKLGFASYPPYRQKIETADKDGDLSNPGVAVPNLIHYVFCNNL